MMSSISSLTPTGTASARLGAGAGAGDPMASAFAMLFALMPGAGDAAASEGGDGLPKAKGDAAKDGSTTEQDGKDLPSDAAPLPVMPFAIPTLPLAPPEPVASPVVASGASPAPITTLLGAMPSASPTPSLAPHAPDATPVAASGASPAPITTLLAAMPALPDAELAPTTMPVGATTSVVPDSAKQSVATGKPIAFDPLQGTMPVPSAMTIPDVGEAEAGLPITIRADAPLALASSNTGSSAPLAAPVALMPGNTAAILRNTVPDVQAGAQRAMPAVTPARDTVSGLPIAPDPQASTAMPDQLARTTAPGIPLAIRADAGATAIRVDAVPIVLTSDGARPAPTRQDTPLRFTATSASAPVVAPLPIEAPAPILQAGQTAPAIQLFGLSMRGEQGADPRTDRRKDEAALSVDPATLTRADSLTAAPVMATTGAEQAPLDMTQAHWPQGMIDRIDRMREDAATADTRIQLSPDALGGIAVNLRHEGGATHIHFTADQAQTASMLAEAQPTLARLAEEKGMRLGQTGVDLGQSGTGGERQAPPRRPDPVMPSRPAFTAATASSDVGDPAAASIRIA